MKEPGDRHVDRGGRGVLVENGSGGFESGVSDDDDDDDGGKEVNGGKCFKAAAVKGGWKVAVSNLLNSLVLSIVTKFFLL